MAIIENQAASQLRNVHSLAQLAAVLGVKTKTLSYWLYVADDNARYTQFNIPKKLGGTRRIDAPSSKLKMIQTRLADVLTGIYMELEKARTNIGDDGGELSRCVLAHGFKPHYSIITNARAHRNRRFVFNADLRDFFPSINFGRVRGFLITDRNFRIEPNVATIIAQIACHNNGLPQGAPTSPVLSNLIAHIMDIKLSKLAVTHNCTYTRYADDLTFSTNEKSFPNEIARLVRGSSDKWVAGDHLLARVYASGFSINPEKSRMQLRNSRQDVTGLIVNKRINVREEYYKAARAMCDHLFRYGYCYQTLQGVPQIIPDEKLDGMMTFIHHIRSQQHSDADKTVAFEQRQAAFTKVYSQLLDYRSFHGISMPRLVCEGETDALHINAAIRSLGNFFPNLYNAADRELRVNFYNFTPRAEQFQIAGGVGNLCKFIANYQSRTKAFKQPVSHPVIVIVDNDKEGGMVWKQLDKVLKEDVDGSASFYHVISNLYVVPIPKNANKDTSIEDLHTADLLATTINGRVFNKSNKSFDKNKFYGKVELATQIVRPKRASIDWSGFDPLLKRLEEVISDYAARLTGA